MAKKGNSQINANSAAAIAAEQTLPSKFANLFKQIVRCYEQKQYKKGLKTSDQVLKKYPHHGETLAMKGLILNCMEKKDEGEDLIRSGLRYNIKSHVCWHVYGLLHRSNRNYGEAIKCYLNALRIDVDNLQILKDLSLLQVQMRDMNGFSETRRKILVLKSSNKNNWIAYAIGQHLAGDYAQALEILKTYEATVENFAEIDYEQSEMLLYKNQVIEESGDLDGCLKHLDEIEKSVADKLSLKEKKAALLLKLQKLDESRALYSELVDINPDNLEYHDGLHKSLGLVKPLSEEQVKQFVSLYESLKEKHPKVNTIDRVPLDFLSGPLFSQRVESYLKYRLRKGIPSLCRDLRPLYSDASKKAVIDQLIQSFLLNLREKSKFSSEDTSEENPSALLWTLFYACQHFDFLKKPLEALKVIDEAIEHTPTSMDLYLAKARVFKHGGDFVRAHYWADQARLLDLADRYLNTISVKYAWRAHKPQIADQTACLFLKDGDKLISLFEMQAMWYEWASGKAFVQMGQYGKALKKLTAIQKHYEDMHEDQFDFHTYCLRKMTLRSYVECLRFEDRIRDHKFFKRASKAIVECYLLLEDDKSLLLKPEEGTAKKTGLVSKKEDLDPEGLSFLRIPDPLGEAVKHVKLMEQYCPKFISTQSLTVEVYSRRGKFLLALRAVKRGLSLDATHPDLLVSIVKFIQRYGNAQVHPTTKTIVDEEIARTILTNGSSLQSFVSNYTSKHAVTLPQRVGASQALLLLDASQTSKVGDLLMSTPFETAKLSECVDALQFIKKHVSSLSDKFISAVAPHFPLSVVFHPELAKYTENEVKEEEPMS